MIVFQITDGKIIETDELSGKQLSQKPEQYVFLLPPIQISKIGHYYTNQKYDKNVPSMIAAALNINKKTHMMFLHPTLESHYHILWLAPTSTLMGRVKAIIGAVSGMVMV